MNSAEAYLAAVSKGLPPRCVECHSMSGHRLELASKAINKLVSAETITALNLHIRDLGTRCVDDEPFDAVAQERCPGLIGDDMFGLMIECEVQEIFDTTLTK